jgi:signal transduction histidine kinase
MKRTSWYRTALVGALILVLTNTWLASRALHTLFDTQFWQAHTLEVISDTQHLVASIRTAESAARGFILTDSQSFADQFQQADAQMNDDLAQLQRTTGDNASQQERIRVLRLRVIEKMNVLRDGMAIRRNQPKGSLDPEQLGPVVADTPDRVESVQVTIRAIEAEEQRLLVQRTSATAYAKREVWISFGLAFILDFVLVVAAFELLMRAGRDRERIAEDAARIASLNGELSEVNAQLSVVNSELTLVNSALESRVQQRTRELEVSNQELEAFSYSVSHDLRAPLRTIDGFSLALMEDFSDKLNDEGRDYIGRVRAGVQRMGTLIDALLQLSRVTRSELQAEKVNLSQLATLVFHELASADPERKVEFSAEPGVMVFGDPRLLRISLENLMGNAWKFTSKTENARIEFGTRQADGGTVYFIRDNGAGFDMHYVDRLFTAFQRLHGDRDFKGSGIGLATVSRIIRRHHGTIGAEGEPGHGATFFFTLPSEAEQTPS